MTGLTIFMFIAAIGLPTALAQPFLAWATIKAERQARKAYEANVADQGRMFRETREAGSLKLVGYECDEETKAEDRAKNKRRSDLAEQIAKVEV